MKNITIRKDAVLDIDDAYHWYETNKDGLGEIFLDSIAESFRKMRESPKIYPTVYKSVRRAFVHKFPYGIFYFENNNFITVVAVKHAKKNPINWQERI